MKTEILNTLKDIKATIEAGKKSLKSIAAECSFFERQANEDEARAAFARLSDCKTRKEFAAVLSSLEVK